MISKQEVKHIAKLARLGLNEAEIKKFQKELSSVLDYFNLLKEVDVSNVEPTFHPLEHFLEGKLGLTREDIEKSQRIEVVNKLVEATPERKDRYIKTKAVLQ
jgi:aspartyl-tRNA(Asn)/glutamyl-tRNA(Gln) amidotransferase subunit C